MSRPRLSMPCDDSTNVVCAAANVHEHTQAHFAGTPHSHTCVHMLTHTRTHNLTCMHICTHILASTHALHTPFTHAPHTRVHACMHTPFANGHALLHHTHPRTHAPHASTSHVHVLTHARIHSHACAYTYTCTRIHAHATRSLHTRPAHPPSTPRAP